MLGILTAVYLLLKKGFFRPPKGDRNFNLIIYLIFAAIIGGRLGYVLFYDFSQFWNHPVNILKMWDGGMSSFGGFIATALVLFFWREENKPKFLDTLTIPFLVAWIIGRIGCFLIHDHPGRFTNFFLAVQFPSATIHDMALYETLLLLLFFIVVETGFKPVSTTVVKYDGFLFASFILYYSFFRFFLDFLRVLDPRWFGLVPSQYGAILFFVFGLILLRKIILTKKEGFARIKK